MATKLNTFQYTILTNAGKTRVCLLPALNYMDAVSKVMSQGFLISLEGKVVPSTSISDFDVVRLEEGTQIYQDFAKKNEELLRGLRLM